MPRAATSLMGLSLGRRVAAVAGNYAGIVARALRWKGRRVPSAADAARQARRILIVRCDHIGDAFMSVPAIAWVRHTFPGAHISLMVASWSRALFEGNPDVDELIVHDPPWWTKRRRARFGSSGAAAGEDGLLATMRRLRAQPYDLCLELRGDPRQMLAYGYLARARYIVSRNRHGATGFADFAPTIDESLHEVEQNLQLVKLLAPQAPLQPQPIRFHKPIGERERSRALALLASNEDGALPPGSPSMTVVAHPGAKHVNQWPAAHWRAWANGLLAWGGLGLRIMLTGGPGEQALCADIAQGHQQITVLAGQLSLRETAALMEKAQLVVMGDTGPMHLLNALTTPALLLFGPTPPSRYAPQGEHIEIIQGEACCVATNHEVCLRTPAPAPSACMASITPERVLQRTRATLAASMARMQEAPTAQ